MISRNMLLIPKILCLQEQHRRCQKLKIKAESDIFCTSGLGIKEIII